MLIKPISSRGGDVQAARASSRQSDMYGNGRMSMKLHTTKINPAARWMVANFATNTFLFR